jgi:ankyrin repeat protein
MTDPQSLINAIIAGDEATVTQLLAADPALARGAGPTGESLVLLAVYRRHPELAPLIARHSGTGACEAAAMGDLKALEAVLGKSRDAVHSRSGDGWTPLHLAGFFGHTKIAERLIDAGADLEAVSENATHNMPLHAAIAGSCDRPFVALLLERGADVNARGGHGITPLHLAASRGADDLVDQLIARGADPTARMDDGKLPADYAGERGFPALADSLRARAKI